eukprot:5821178-Alexandrium_andersonii.AAC.1
MSASLVGSEMCIRDSLKHTRQLITAMMAVMPACHCRNRNMAMTMVMVVAVSYTHLTLPTICSV